MADPVVNQVWTRKGSNAVGTIIAVADGRVAILDTEIGIQSGTIADLEANYDPPVEAWREPVGRRVWAGVLPDGTLDFFRTTLSDMDRGAARIAGIPAIIQCDVIPDLLTLEIP